MRGRYPGGRFFPAHFKRVWGIKAPHGKSFGFGWLNPMKWIRTDGDYDNYSNFNFPLGVNNILDNQKLQLYPLYHLKQIGYDKCGNPMYASVAMRTFPYLSAEWWDLYHHEVL